MSADDAAAVERPPIDLHSMNVELFDVDTLEPYNRNSRDHSEADIVEQMRMIEVYGFTTPLCIREDRVGIIAGHKRREAARRLGMKQVPGFIPRGWTPELTRAYVIWDNRGAEKAGWNLPILELELSDLAAAGIDLNLTGWGAGALADVGISLSLPGDNSQAPPTSPPAATSGGAGSLAERFGIPPFSVLNAREGWWQDRKRAWIGLGIKSELGRGEGATYGDGDEITEPGLNHYRNRAKAFADGTVKGAGRGGLADQLAASLKGGEDA